MMILQKKKCKKYRITRDKVGNTCTVEQCFGGAVRLLSACTHFAYLPIWALARVILTKERNGHCNKQRHLNDSAKSKQPDSHRSFV
jgi:hypothetical protein